MLCLLALPFIALGAVVVMVSLRTVSPFFFQTRIGRSGKDIRFPKLRTMPRSMPEYALKTTVSFAHLPAAMKFLRKLHIDELPQLFLVVTGTVSLVGPRPKMPDIYEPVTAPYGTTRVQVPQGCTGLWQISAHKYELPSDYPEYDLFYVAHQSFRLDLWILWRTLAHGLRLTKLVTLADVPVWARRPTAAPALPWLDLTDTEPVALALADEAR
jgi:lipopolysaccharide/colanic/teichoic acid biosynthesis glycosyltransferase